MQRPPDPSPTGLAADEPLLLAFDRAWFSGPSPDLAAFLQSVPPNISADRRRRLLVELIKIDLEHQWRQGPPSGSTTWKRPALEDYLRRFPELSTTETLPVDLIAQEYETRLYGGDRPRLDEYLQRFPRQAESLRQILPGVETAWAAEAGGQAKALPAATPAVPTPVARRLPSSAELVQFLQQLALLPPERMRTVQGELLASFPQARGLAQELLRRGWLTPYQVNQLLSGRGGELILGPYLLLERLGEGGTGRVLKGMHRGTRRLAAIKLIRSELLADEEVIARFNREVRIISRLSHPNIVHAYDAGPTPTGLMLAMEFVDGTNLSEMLKERGPLPVALACDYVRQAALALQHAHERNLIHRDIKPSNLMVNRNGQIKLLDLGLGRLRRGSDGEATVTLGGASLASSLTPVGAVMMGTPDYMAPEQAIDFHQADIRSDIYSLGCTFYCLLAGKPPFSSSSLAVKIMRHQQASPPSLRAFRPEVPAAVADLIERMLAKSPAERPQTPGEIAAALEGFARGKKPRWPHFSWRWRRRKWPAVGALVGGLIVLLLSWIVMKRTGDGVLPLSADESPAGRDLAALLAKAPNEPARLRSQLIAFRNQYPWTPAALRAAEKLHELPSPLDSLNARDIPAVEQEPFNGKPPPQLVAVLGQRRFRHPGPLEILAVSPDGKTVAASGVWLGNVQLFDTATWTRKEHLDTKGHANFDLAWSPDSRFLALTGANRPRMWDFQTRKWIELPNPDTDSNRINGLDFSRDGRWLATAGDDGSLRLWDLQRPKEPTRKWTVGPKQTDKVRFSPDGKLLFSIDRRHVLLAWDALTGKEAIVPSEAKGLSVAALDFSSDGRLLAMGADNAKVQIGTTRAGEKGPSFGLPTSARCVAFASDGKTLAAGDHSGRVHVWPAEGGKTIASWVAHAGDVLGVALLAKGRTLVSAGNDGMLRVWDVASQKELFSGHGHLGAVNAVCFSSDGNWIASGGLDGSVRLWSAATAQEAAVFDQHHGAIQALAADPTGPRLASAGQLVCLWDIESRGLRFSRQWGKLGGIGAIAFTPDGQALTVGGQYGQVSLARPLTAQEPAPLFTTSNDVESLLAGPAENSLLSCSRDGTIVVWSLARHREIKRWTPAGSRRRAYRGLAFSPNGKALATGNDDGSVALWNTADYSEITSYSASSGTVQTVAFDPLNRRLAAAARDGALVLWELTTGKQVLRLALPTPILGLAFAPDSRYLVTANGNGTLYVFRLDTLAAK